MIVSINQPAYLPWLGYFHRIAISDVHIVLDHVQYEKNSFTNRNRIRTPDGSMWLTVPLRTKGRFGELPIREVEIVGTQRWREKHWNALLSNYSAAGAFREHSSFFEDMFRQEWTSLGPLLRASTAYLLRALRIDKPLRFSSDMQPTRRKDELILELCREVGASTYISGPLGRDYLDPKVFHDAGIELTFHEYGHPSYRQAFDGFESHMSVVDLLFNHGVRSGEILMGGSA